MADTMPITIAESPWFVEESGTPTIGEEFGLRIAITDALNGETATKALLGVYRLEPIYAEMYGGSIPAAIHIVVLEPKTGRVRVESVAVEHAVPLAEVMNPDPTPEEDEDSGLERIATRGYFNVDLLEFLGLPPEAATYRVFAWLDDRTSPIVDLEVPEDKAGGRRTQAPRWRAKPELLNFARSDYSPAVAKAPVALTYLRAKPRDPDVGNVTVYGQIAPKLLPKAPPKEDESPTYVTVLALGHRNRELRWHETAIPDEVIEAKEGCFEFNLKYIVNATEEPQRIFVLCCVGTEVSEVLVIEPPAQRKTGDENG